MKWATRGMVLSAVLAMALAPGMAMADSIAGTTSGAFVNPQPNGATVTGVGTSTFTWGISGAPSSLTFAGSPFSTTTGTPFYLGTLTYFNGTIAGGSGATSVDLQVNTNFSTPPVGNIQSAFTLSITDTTNTGDPVADADFVTLPSTFTPTIFTINGTQYTLALLGFQNLQGNGFLDSTTTQFHVLEGGTASADLYGIVTTDLSGISPSTPLPSAAWGGIGIIGLLAGLKVVTRRRELARA